MTDQYGATLRPTAPAEFHADAQRKRAVEGTPAISAPVADRLRGRKTTAVCEVSIRPASPVPVRLLRTAAALGATMAALLVGSSALAAPRQTATTEAPRSVVGMQSKTVKVGAVTVKVQPKLVDARGAEFSVSLDTHSADLGIDLVKRSTLTIGTRRWKAQSWTGDGPAGHHRSGTLRFAGGGPVAGVVTLRIDGLDEPVSLTWNLR